jgi:hypothetical protein
MWFVAENIYMTYWDKTELFLLVFHAPYVASKWCRGDICSYSAIVLYCYVIYSILREGHFGASKFDFSFNICYSDLEKITFTRSFQCKLPVLNFIKINIGGICRWTSMFPCARYEGVWLSRGIAPQILNLGTRGRFVIKFTSRLLYFRRYFPLTRWTEGWICPRAGRDVRFGEE